MSTDNLLIAGKSHSSRLLLTIDAQPSSIGFSIFRYGTRIQAQPELTGCICGTGDGGRVRLSVMNRDDLLLEDSLLPVDAGAACAGLPLLVGWLRDGGLEKRLAGVGHRVLHGGWRYSQPLLLDDAAVEQLRGSVLLGPLHQTHHLDAIDTLRRVLPAVPHVACFDTGFHRQGDAVPPSRVPSRAFEHGMRKCGTHGLAYEYVAEVLPDYLGRRADGCVVAVHLGGSASLCGMRERRSLSATESFTAGSPNGERVDPFTSDAPQTFEARERFCSRIVREIGALAAALGGLDALVFTGRAAACAASLSGCICGTLGWLGIELDHDASAAGAVHMAGKDSRAEILLLPANEEWIVARHTARQLVETTPA